MSTLLFLSFASDGFFFRPVHGPELMGLAEPVIFLAWPVLPAEMPVSLTTLAGLLPFFQDQEVPHLTLWNELTSYETWTEGRHSVNPVKLKCTFRQTSVFEISNSECCPGSI